MFPRNRALFIQKGATVEEAMELCLKRDIIRIPVYHNDLDNIIGMIDSKDLIPYYMGIISYVFYRDILKRDDTSEISDVVHFPCYVPSSKNIFELYLEMLENG